MSPYVELISRWQNVVLLSQSLLELAQRGEWDLLLEQEVAYLQGIETLSLRVERHVYNALRVVDFLTKHPKVKRVNHPSLAAGREKELYDKYYPNGGASIFTFEFDGTREQAQKFTESLELFSLLANVADVKSLVIHPASTTHSQMSEEELAFVGIQPTTIRLSIGTEHIDDILADLAQAFDRV